MSFEGFYGTKSGCQIAKVSPVDDDHDSDVIFKEGDKSKIEREYKQIMEWRRVAPGVGPDFAEYHEKEHGASLLVSYIEGTTFQEILLGRDRRLLAESSERVQTTLARIWRETREDGEVRPRFLTELLSRMEDMEKAHPDLVDTRKQIGGLEIPSFRSLLMECLHLDELAVAPFSVWTHGDFNTDNIIYNSDERRVHFIDLNRSGRADYSRDIAVFMVSNYRLPVFDKGVRELICEVVADFYGFANGFARSIGDDRFEMRLALGVARSLATSTRFELNEGFAGDMMSRARYLVDAVRAHAVRAQAKRDDEFRFPVEVLCS